MIMKRICAWLLCILAVGAACSACGDTTAENPENKGTEAIAETDAVTEEVDNFDPFAGLPEKDYEGYEVKMLLRPLQRWTEDMYVEAASGDIVDDAIFNRNLRVGEKFNLNIVCIPSSHPNSEMDAKTAILAGDDAYDIVMAHGRAAFEYANQHLLLDWNTELPYVNLENVWWDQDARNSLSINDKLYVMIGDISYCSMGAANVMLFNKNMFNELDLTYPYQDVYDGKWTFEKWDGLCRLASADLNGDGAITQDYDRFGYTTQKWVGPVQAFATSGLRVVQKDEKGVPYISFFSERTVEVFNRYFELIDSDNAFVDTNDVSYSADFIKIFEEGRALFIDMNMEDVITMRSMDTDFGIIPWPKYDEASDYCTNVDAGTNMCIIPMTAKDPERTSIVLEAMGAIGYHDVLPAYFEVALQTKVSRDNESAEMLDIIKTARIFDLGYYNANMSGTYANEFVDFTQSIKNRDITSWYEKNLKTVQKAFDKVMAEYQD